MQIAIVFVVAWAACVAGNYAAQAMKLKKWDIALDRSYFQGVAIVITYGVLMMALHSPF